MSFKFFPKNLGFIQCVVFRGAQYPHSEMHFEKCCLELTSSTYVYYKGTFSYQRHAGRI